MRKENDLEGVQDQGRQHGGRTGMPRPEHVLPQQEIKVLRVTSGDRSSRETSRVRSKSAKQMRSGDEVPGCGDAKVVRSW